PYVEPVFRPPAEAGSVILQVTNGCSWNRCSFCEMYTAPQKAFRAKPMEEVESDLRLLRALPLGRPPGVPPRVFLADGDAMSLPASQLRGILRRIAEAFPDVARVSSYCLPRNLRGKSVEELRALRALGLRTLYVGCESGDDEVLRRVGKGETRASQLEALGKIREAGLKASVMILHGLGGEQLSLQHAEGSAAMLNAAQPELLSTLVVSFPLGRERHAACFEDLPGGGFQELSPGSVLREMEQLLQRLELRRTIQERSRLELPGAAGRAGPRQAQYGEGGVDGPRGRNQGRARAAAAGPLGGGRRPHRQVHLRLRVVPGLLDARVVPGERAALGVFQGQGADPSRAGLLRPGCVLEGLLRQGRVCAEPERRQRARGVARPEPRGAAGA
ncbi:unnamed protein product, partial [Prorocentrum cordatum]